MTKSLHVAIAEFSTNFDDYRLIVTEGVYPQSLNQEKLIETEIGVTHTRII